MKKQHQIRPRAALFIGAALFATPAFAQDAPTVTPPPIQVTPAPAPAAPAPVIQMQPAAPVVQAVPDVPKAQTPPAYARREATAPAATRQTRTATRATTTTRAPAAATAAPVAAPAASAAPVPPAEPIATAPAPEVTTPAPVAVAPVETVPTTTATSERTTSSTLPWLLGGIALVVAGLAALMLLMRRRRVEPEYVEETAYTAPVADPVVEPAVVPVATMPVRAPEPVIERAPIVERSRAPAFAAPIAEPEVRDAQSAVATAEDVSVSEPEKADLAGVVDGTAPVARRPWLELGMRPVRAGTNKDEALVDFELTVGNSGDTAARDVRISTFMLADGGSEGEMERLLTANRDDSAVPPVTIEPGEGTRIDAHLATSKEELGRSFNPVIVAEARYTLPDGRQGRTSAAFKIGCPSENGMRPLASTRPFVTETVEAELVGTPEHA